MATAKTNIYLEITDTVPVSHVLRNVSVLYVSLYIGGHNFSYHHTPSKLLKSPGCITDSLHVSGVANTTRHLLLLQDGKHPLLGHNAGCLSGIKEVSPWTKVVEVTLPNTLAKLASLGEVKESLNFLRDLFDTPFIGHNQRKIRQEAIKLGVLPEHGILSHEDWNNLPVMRLYIHGLHLNATDILVYGMIHAKLASLDSSILELRQTCQEYVLFVNWLERMDKVMESTLKQCYDFPVNFGTYINVADEEDEEDLLVDTVTCEKLSSVCEDSIQEIISKQEYGDNGTYVVRWDDLNDDIKPQRNNTGNQNKMNQLQSMLGGVVSCVEQFRETREGGTPVTIVDFCSGAGHLGIFLAHQIPTCQVILVETKWGSLRYAQERVTRLGLSNVTLCLTHMAGFCGTFDIGVSLHACGSATDLVIRQCVANNAAVVSAPCCYGKITKSKLVDYPKSKHFRDTYSIMYPEFIKICKLADHERDNEDYMKCVDVDRLNHLSDHGYRYCTIQKLKPLTCSPKNNLIVAIK